MAIDQNLLDFYTHREEEQRFSSKHGSVEFIVTRAFIDRYLRPGDRVLEVGSGTGRYALHYARQGYRVDAIELLETHLEVLRQNTLPTDNITARQGNALDLSSYGDGQFDVTLVLGPMYHFFTEEEKLRCLREALRVTKAGGHLFVAYCQFDASMIQAVFFGGMYDFVVENHLLDEARFLPISDPFGIFEIVRKEQVDRLNEQLPVERLHYVGTDMFSQYYPAELDAMEDRLFEKYLAYTFSICENQNVVGVSNHTLDVLRKK